MLIGLRALQGTITGFATACATLIAAQADKKHAGVALGTLSTSSVAGTLLGPVVGGFIEDTVGLRPVFFITGSLVFVAFIIALLFVKEDFVREDKKVQSMRAIWRAIPEKDLTVVLCVTYFIITLGLNSIEPIITVYVTQLSVHLNNIALIAGLAFSVSGLANLVAAPVLGRLSDRTGAHKIPLFALIAAGFSG